MRGDGGRGQRAEWRPWKPGPRVSAHRRSLPPLLPRACGVGPRRRRPRLSAASDDGEFLRALSSTDSPTASPPTVLACFLSPPASPRLVSSLLYHLFRAPMPATYQTVSVVCMFGEWCTGMMYLLGTGIMNTSARICSARGVLPLQLVAGAPTTPKGPR